MGMGAVPGRGPVSSKHGLFTLRWWENFGGDTFFSLPHHHQVDIA